MASPSPGWGVSLDPTLRVLGGRSRYQVLQLLVINMGVWGAAFQLLDNIFTGRKITWHQCAHPGNYSGSSASRDIILTSQLHHVNWSSDHVVYGECEITVMSDYHNETYPCLFGYIYDYYPRLSFRTEFNLVCGRALLADLLQTVVIMGQGLGAFFACYISDRYGRKGILVWSQLGLLVVGMGIALAPNYPFLATLKFAAGCLQQGVMTGKATMSIELFPSEFRSMTSLMMAMMWMTGTCVMAVTSFLLRESSWRCLQAVLSAVSLVALLQMWYIDESLRWLMANGKKDSALRVLHRAARVNRQDPTVVLTALYGDVTTTPRDVITSHDGNKDLESEPSLPEERPPPPPPINKRSKLRKRSRTFDDDDWEPGGTSPGGHRQEEEQEAEEDALGHPSEETLTVREIVGEQKPSQKLTLMDVFRHRRLRRYTLLVWAAWFTGTFSAFSLYVMSTGLHGNRFVNFFLTASMKLPSGLLFYYMVDRSGRRAGISLFFLLAAIGLLSSGFLRAFQENSLFAMLSVPASLIGAMGATGIFGAMFLYTPELYPTNIRQQALGYASMVGRLGGMIAPFMIPLSDVFPWAPGLITGSMCLGIIFLFRRLPETRGRELPQTLEDIDQWETTLQEEEDVPGGGADRGREWSCRLHFVACARAVPRTGHVVYAWCVRLVKHALTQQRERQHSQVVTV